MTNEVETVDYNSVSLVSGQDTELNSVEIQTEEKYPIFSFGTEAGPGVILPKGKIRGTFLGTVPMFSKTFKENWDELEVEGQVIYASKHFAFTDANGNKFGIFSSSNLWKLTKIPTAISGKAFKNPTVEVEYVGKVEGRDVLEKEFGIKIQKGNSAHVFNVKTDTQVDMTIEGCVNYLRNPIPSLGAKKEGRDAIETARKSWERQQKLQAGLADNHTAIEMQ